MRNKFLFLQIKLNVLNVTKKITILEVFFKRFNDESRLNNKHEQIIRENCNEHLQYKEDLTQGQLDEQCQNCIVELIKGFIF